MTHRWGAARAAPLTRVACDLASFLLPVAAYVASASHEPGSWDTAELQGVPYILGITHPTGFPLYVLAGYVWSHAFALGSIAYRLNVMSAVVMAAAGSAAYATALEIGAWRPIALLATLWYAFAPDVWSHASRAEAQDLAVACEAFAVYAFVRWLLGGGGSWFLGACALVGLGMAAHPNAMWLVPAIVLGALAAKRRPSWRLAAGSAAVGVCALLFYVYLPLRSAYIVAHNLDPTAALPGAGGGIFWNYNDPSTPGGLLRALSGSESEAPRYVVASFNPVHLQQALWAFFEGTAQQFGAFALVLLAIGAVRAWKRDWRTTAFLCVACTTALVFSVTYSNEADVGRYRMMSLWLAVPLLGAVLPRNERGKAVPLRWAMCAFVAIEIAASFYHQRSFFARKAGEGGRWIIQAVAPVAPPGSVVIVDGWLDATSLAYGAYVDRSLPGRIVVSGWDPKMAGTYRSWARRRPVYVLTDPRATAAIPGAGPPTRLDPYHELFRIKP